MYNKNVIATLIAVLFTSQLYLAGLVLPGLYANYPDVNSNVIMLFYTLPLLLNGIVGLGLGAIIGKANKKMLVSVGLIAIIIGGVLIVFLGKTSLIVAIVGSVLLGVGNAFTQNACGVILAMENPAATERMVALNVAFASLGSMFLSTVGGILAKNDWTRLYLLCFLCIASLVIFILLFRAHAPQSPAGAPEEGAPSAAPEAAAPAKNMGLFIGIIIVFFCIMMNQAAFLPNYATFVVDKGIGTTVESGLINTIGAFGGMIGGLFLVGPFMKIFRKWTVPIGIIMLLLPNLSIVIGNKSWLLIAILNFVSMAGLQVTFGMLSGAGNKAIGPAALTTLTAMMGLVNFAGPYLINALTTSGGLDMKFMVGMCFAVVGTILSVPLMLKASKE